jgi:SAM-dependent MidA family methyltransferase
MLKGCVRDAQGVREGRMSNLANRLKRQIKLTGPMSISDYWAQCLFDPEDGYYITREPFGAQGDFTTAPEISQMFGEMLAAWWLTTIQQNALDKSVLVEIGPGRGTLMADMLRTIEKLDPSAINTFDIHMLETSDRLIGIQKNTLKSSKFSITWHKKFDTLPKQPFGIVANELFDAIPIRQFIKTADGWQERCIGLNSNEAFCFLATPASLHASILPKDHNNQPLGTIFEHSPAREGLMQQLSQHIQNNGGFALFIDYGYSKPGFADTLQALKKHKFINVLEDQGMIDITSHVDFFSLSTIAKSRGLQAYSIMDQGDFLMRLGIKNRMERLISVNPDQQNTFITAFERLTKNEQMGSLFKMLGIAHQAITLPVLQISS